jgi:hypothetical protein
VAKRHILRAGQPTNFLLGVGDFSLLLRVKKDIGSTLSSIQWVPRAPSSGEKKQGCELDYLSPPSAHVKNEQSCSLLPLYVLMACTGTNVRRSYCKHLHSHLFMCG